MKLSLFKKRKEYDYEKIVRMGYEIQRHLETGGLFDARPRDLMDHLIEKKFFDCDMREGKPLRDILRHLDDNSLLFLLPQVRVDRSEANRQWYFNALRF
jgi:hypothetical protein